MPESLNEQLQDKNNQNAEIHLEEEKTEIQIQKPAAFLDENEYKKHLISAIKENNANLIQNNASQFKMQNTEPKNSATIDDNIYKTNITTVLSAAKNAFVNGDVNTGYNQLLKLCLFNPAEEAYMQYVEGDELGQKIPTYINERLENLPSFKDVIELGSCVYNMIRNDGDLYQANLNYTQLNQIEDKYLDEEKAKLNFIASKMFLNTCDRKITGIASLTAQDNELECLNKVLSYSTDYNLIAYCQKRLSPKDDKLVVRAYKHALEKNDNPQNLYNICITLSDIYSKRSQKIGFAYEGGDKKQSIQKAQKYLMHAYRYATPDKRLNILKKLSTLQLADGDIKGWENIKTVIAYKFLIGEERCFALNAIGDKVRNIQYYKMAIEECDNSSLPETNKRNIKEISYKKMIKLMPEGQEKQQTINILNQLKKENMQDFNNMLLLLGNDKQK